VAEDYAADFDQALQDIANKYGASVGAVKNIVAQDPVLSQFDPANPQDWSFSLTDVPNLAPVAQEYNPGRLSDSLLATIREGWENGKSEPVEDVGFFKSLLDVGIKVIDVIDTPRAIVTSAVKEVGDIFDSDEQFSLTEFYEQSRDNIGFGDVIQDWAPGLGEVELFGVKPLDNIAGFIGEVALDPFTWLTLGTLPAAKAGTMGIVKMLAGMGDAGKARQVFRGGIRALSGDDMSRLTDFARSTGRIGADDVIDGGLQFRIPLSKTFSRFTSGKVAPKQIRLMSQDNLFLKWTPRVGVNVVAQKFRMSRMGGVLGGDRALSKRMLVDPDISDAEWLDHFNHILIDNVARAKERGLRTTLENSWGILAKRLIDADITGADIQRALGFDEPPEGMNPAIWREIKDFAEKIRKDANDIVGEEWIPFRDNWQLSIPTAEWVEYLTKNGNRNPIFSDPQGIAHFEKKANIVEGAEFMGVTLRPPSEAGATVREQARQIFNEHAQELGGAAEAIKWFNDDVYEAMPIHIKLVSQRARRKFTHNEMIKAGIIQDRIVESPAAIKAQAEYDQIERDINELAQLIEDTTAAANAMDAARPGVAEEVKELYDKLMDLRRKKAALFNVEMPEPDLSNNIWRRVAAESVEYEEQLDGVIDAVSTKTAQKVDEIDSAIDRLERHAEFLEAEEARIKGGYYKLLEIRNELWARGSVLRETLDQVPLDEAKPLLEELDRIAQDLRDITEPLAQARADWLAQAGEANDALIAMAKPTRVVASAGVTIGKIREIRKLFRAQAHVFGNMVRNDPKWSPWLAGVGAEPAGRLVRARMDELLDDLGLPAGMNIKSIAQLDELEAKLMGIIQMEKANIRRLGRLGNETIRDYNGWAEWQEQLQAEFDDVLARLGEIQLDPDIAEGIQEALTMLRVNADGYLSFGDQTVLWHGFGPNYDAVDLTQIPDPGKMNTSEWDSFLHMHLAFDPSTSLKYAGRDPSKVLGFKVRASNPVVFGGSIEDIARGQITPYGQTTSSHRGRGLSQLHTAMLDSAVEHGHVTLEWALALRIPNAEKIWALMERGFVVPGQPMGLKVTYSEAAAIVNGDNFPDMFEEIVQGLMADPSALRGMKQTGWDFSVPGEREKFISYLRAAAEDDPTLLGRMMYTPRDTEPLGTLAGNQMARGVNGRYIIEAVDNAIGRGLRPLPPIPHDAQSLLELPSGDFFNQYIRPFTDNEVMGGGASSPLTPRLQGGKPTIADRKAFDEGTYGETGDLSRGNASVVELWKAGIIQRIPEIMQEIAADFKHDLKRMGYDSIVYSGFEHGGKWNVVPLDPPRQLEPFTGNPENLGGFTTLRGDYLGEEALEELHRAGSAVSEIQHRSVFEDFWDAESELARRLGEDPETKFVFDNIRGQLNMRVNTNAWRSSDAKRPSIFEETANTIDDLFEQINKFATNPGGELPNFNKLRGRAAQRIGKIDELADRIEAMEVSRGVDAAQRTSPLIRQLSDGLRKALADTMVPTQQINRAVATARAMGATGGVKAATAAQSVSFIEAVQRRVALRKTQLQWEMFDLADSLSPHMTETLGRAQAAGKQASRERAEIARLERELAELDAATNKELSDLRTEQLRFRWMAVEAYEAAERVDLETQAAAKARFDAEQAGREVALEAERQQVLEQRRALWAEGKRMDATSSAMHADVLQMTQGRDALAEKFAKMKRPEQTTMMLNVLDGHVAVGSHHMMPEAIAEAMADVNRILGPSATTPFMKTVDRVTELFKAWAIASPGFHMRNFFGGVFNNALASVEISSYSRFHSLYNPKTGKGTLDPGNPKGERLTVADAIRRGYGVEDQVKLMRSTKTAQQLIDSGQGNVVDGMEQLIRAGMLTGGQTTELARYTRVGNMRTARGRYNPFNPNNLLTTAARSPATGVENYLRGSLALDRLIKGQDVDLALTDVYKYHFDYDDLSSFERGVMRRLIPFYTWTRKNFPLQLEMMVTNPKVYNRVYSLKREIERETEKEELLPSWIAERFHIEMPFSFGGDPLYLVPDLPFTELDRATNPRLWMASTTPIVKIPMEQLTGKNFFFDSDFRDDYRPLPSAWSATMAPFLPALGAVGLVKRQGDNYVATDRHMHHLESVLPIYGALRRLFGSPGDDKFDDRQLQNWVNWTSGIGFRRITESMRESEQWRRENADWLNR
jgi:hypothetical protein